MFPENYEFYFIARSEGQEMFGRERRVNDCKEDDNPTKRPRIRNLTLNQHHRNDQNITRSHFKVFGMNEALSGIDSFTFLPLSCFLMSCNELPQACLNSDT